MNHKMNDKDVRYFDYDENDKTDAPLLLEFKKRNVIVKAMMTYYVFGIRLYSEISRIGLISFDADSKGRYQYTFTPDRFSRLNLKRGHLEKIEYTLQRLNDENEV